MPQSETRFPPYFKYTTVLFGLILSIYALVEAKELLIPLAIALVFALLLYPFCKKLESFRLPRALAAGTSILLLLGVVVGIGYLLFLQLDSMGQELPTLNSKLNDKLDSIQEYLEATFGMNQERQSAYVKQSINNFLRNSGSVFSTTFNLTAGLFNYLIVVPISLFFMLYYRKFFKRFLYKLVKRTQHTKLETILSNVQLVIQNYIVGLFTVIAIVAVLNALGLYIVGIKYALFFGVMVSLLTVIPYVGILLGSLVAISYALLTTDSLLYPALTALVFWVVQILEGNLITPNVVGSRVKLNPFVAIVGLLIGGMIWGPAGMILSIPFLAMLKVVLDAIPSTQAYGYVMGVPQEDEPSPAPPPKVS
jgi:predicted PurR-regulated permease PerM